MAVANEDLRQSWIKAQRKKMADAGQFGAASWHPVRIPDGCFRRRDLEEAFQAYVATVRATNGERVG